MNAADKMTSSFLAAVPARKLMARAMAKKDTKDK